MDRHEQMARSLMGEKGGCYPVTAELLAEFMSLPEGYKIVGTEYDKDVDQVYFGIKGPGLDNLEVLSVGRGEPAENGTVLYRMHGEGGKVCGFKVVRPKL